MSYEGLTDLLPRVGIPEADFLVTSTDNIQAVRAESDTSYILVMPSNRLADLLPRIGIPEADSIVVTSANNT